MTEPTKPAYEGDARLVRWADSGGAGRTVTLQIDEGGGEHPFKHLPWGTENGQRMAIVCVLVNDDEEPIGPDQAKANSKRHKARTKSKLASNDAVPEKPKDAAPVVKAETGAVEPKRPSNLAAILCEENEDFQVWLAGKYPFTWDRHYIDGNMLSPAAATATLKEVLGITSRKELDEPGPKADAFDRMRTSFKHRDQDR